MYSDITYCMSNQLALFLCSISDASSSWGYWGIRIWALDSRETAPCGDCRLWLVECPRWWYDRHLLFFDNAYYRAIRFDELLLFCQIRIVDSETLGKRWTNRKNSTASDGNQSELLIHCTLVHIIQSDGALFMSPRIWVLCFHIVLLCIAALLLEVSTCIIYIL